MRRKDEPSDPGRLLSQRQRLLVIRISVQLSPAREDLLAISPSREWARAPPFCLVRRVPKAFDSARDPAGG